MGQNRVYKDKQRQSDSSKQKTTKSVVPRQRQN